jgi:DnaJ homolog subfamily C member 28
MSCAREPDQKSQQMGGDSARRLGSGSGRWVDIVEVRITEARERGDFDNLRGQGQPLHIDANPHAGEKALAYSLLKNNDMLPPEIERGKEIVEEERDAEALLARLRRHKERLQRRVHLVAPDRRSYNLLVRNTERLYSEALTAINSKILSLNITAPPALHQRMIDVEARLRAFHEEFVPFPD